MIRLPLTLALFVAFSASAAPAALEKSCQISPQQAVLLPALWDGHRIGKVRQSHRKAFCRELMTAVEGSDGEMDERTPEITETIRRTTNAQDKALMNLSWGYRLLQADKPDQAEPLLHAAFQAAYRFHSPLIAETALEALSRLYGRKSLPEKDISLAQRWLRVTGHHALRHLKAHSHLAGVYYQHDLVEPALAEWDKAQRMGERMLKKKPGTQTARQVHLRLSVNATTRATLHDIRKESADKAAQLYQAASHQEKAAALLTQDEAKAREMSHAGRLYYHSGKLAEADQVLVRTHADIFARDHHHVQADVQADILMQRARIYLIQGNTFAALDAAWNAMELYKIAGQANEAAAARAVAEKLILERQAKAGR